MAQNTRSSTFARTANCFELVGVRGPSTLLAGSDRLLESLTTWQLASLFPALALFMFVKLKLWTEYVRRLMRRALVTDCFGNGALCEVG